MKLDNVTSGMVVVVTAGISKGAAGLVTKVNPQKQTVALRIGAKIRWFGVEKVEPKHE